MVTRGQSLKFHDSVCPSCRQIKLTYCIMIFDSVEIILSHLPNFDSISGVSLAAAVMSLSYSTIAWTASVHKGIQPDLQYGYQATTPTVTVFNFFTALGDVAFAYAGHNVVLEIQATIPSTPEKPSKGPMWRVNDNILITLEKPTWLIVAANLFVVIHVIGSYQISKYPCSIGTTRTQFSHWCPFFPFGKMQLFAMPVFDMIETVMVKKFHFRPTQMLQFLVRNFYVAATMFVAITFPFSGGLLGFFGGFAFATTTYFLPCIMWLAIYKPKGFSLSWCTNWTCIILGLLLMILSPIGGLRNIILSAKDCHFYN
ncbi:Lysine histidine transporter 1 [Hibiscus syriacus]|uniref:Lysine histidine transporter 1 n=1 Tax=Hibiscus syriacus TaxID=106335 RepID=A0A6A3AZZ9_HIBSY|nr:Lysine histidine transporter 1 [Hibiscus syriacus]